MKTFAGVGQRVRIVRRDDTPAGDPLVGRTAVVRKFEETGSRGAWCAVDHPPAAITGDVVLPARTLSFYDVDSRGLVLLSPEWCEPA